MADIGTDVVILRHPGIGDLRLRDPAYFRLMCYALALVLAIGILMLVPNRGGLLHASIRKPDGHIDPFVIEIGFLLLIVPWMLWNLRRRKSQRLRIGSSGMQMVEFQDRGLPEKKLWTVLWAEVVRARFVYRRVDTQAVGIRLEARGGRKVFINVGEWTAEDPTLPVLSKENGRMKLTGLSRSKLEYLQRSDVVRLLESKGLRFEDEPAYLSDKIAVIIGLSLAAAVFVLVLLLRFMH